MISTLLELSKNNKIGFVCGAFDVLHTGHVLMLCEAKQNCDILVVGLQSDPNIDRKSKNVPVQGMFERYVQIANNKHVDFVVPYSTEDDLYNLLLSLPFNVRFLDEEYKDKNATGKDINIPIYYNKRKHSFSTSGLRKRISDKEIK